MLKELLLAVMVLCGIPIITTKPLQKWNFDRRISMSDNQLSMTTYWHVVTNEAKEKLICQIQKLRNLDNIYVAMVDGSQCLNIDLLFSEFVTAFSFPSYFGYNWAAFDECLNDLDWITFDGIILIIKDFSKLFDLPQTTLNSLIKCLITAQREWSNGRKEGDFSTVPTPFHVILQCNIDQMERIATFLKENQICVR